MHKETYRVFWCWSDAAVDHAMLTSGLHTVFGWRLHVRANANPRSLRNFPMQANGAEMLRLACCLAIERGIEVCAPVHDALLISAPLDRLEADVAATQAAMAEASRLVLDGFELSTEARENRHPERYSDPRGTVMWNKVMGLLGRHERPTPISTAISAVSDISTVPTAVSAVAAISRW
jgi:DNA polymerase I